MGGLILLDNSVVFTGLPSIKGGLDLSPTGLSWVQDAYMLVFGGLLLLGARLGDLLGRRRVFVAGLVVFVGASFLIGAAPSGEWLIASRALQGIGAAIVAPSSLSLLTASFPEGEGRSRAVALYGATAGIGASLGLVVGGAAASWISWQAGFFINLPIGAAMIALATRYLPETPPRTGAFDLAGALLATLGTGTLVFGVIESSSGGWGDPVVLVAVVAAALLAGLVVNEKGAAQPIMPLRLFADRRRTAAYVSRALYLSAMIGFFFTTQLMQGVFGFTALQAGFGFLPMTAVNFAVALAVPRLTRRVGGALPLAAGVVLTLAGTGLAQPGRCRRRIPGSGRVAHAADRRWAGLGLRTAHLLRHRRRASGGSRSGVRPGEHLPPARHGAGSGGAGRRLGQRTHLDGPVLPRPAHRYGAAQRLPAHRAHPRAAHGHPGRCRLTRQDLEEGNTCMRATLIHGAGDVTQLPDTPITT